VRVEKEDGWPGSKGSCQFLQSRQRGEVRVGQSLTGRGGLDRSHLEKRRLRAFPHQGASLYQEEARTLQRGEKKSK